jgi:hypothetical protein
MEGLEKRGYFMNFTNFLSFEGKKEGSSWRRM